MHHKRRRAPAGEEAFSSFFERDVLRENRQRSRRKTLVLSLVVHGLALLGLVGYSLWEVDELWTPSVKVKVYSRSAAPPEAVELVKAPPAPGVPAPSR